MRIAGPGTDRVLAGPIAGFGQVLAEDVRQLRKMAKKGESRSVLAEMMCRISDKAAHAISLPESVKSKGLKVTPHPSNWSHIPRNCTRGFPVFRSHPT